MLRIIRVTGDEPWDFSGRNDAKAETPVLWPPHAKSWLIGKDSDAGRDWRQEEKGMTEDEMARWHHWLDRGEFEWTPGDGDGQGGLACCDSWGRKESDATEQLNWTELNWRIINFSYLHFPGEYRERLMTRLWKQILTLTIRWVIRCSFLSITKVIVNRNGWAIVSQAIPCSVFHWVFLQGHKIQFVGNNRDTVILGSRGFNNLMWHYSGISMNNTGVFPPCHP